MNTETTVPVTTLGAAVGTLIVTVLVLLGVDLGDQETTALLSGAVATIVSALLGYFVPRNP